MVLNVSHDSVVDKFDLGHLVFAHLTVAGTQQRAALLAMMTTLCAFVASRTFVMYSDEFNGKAVDDYYCARFNDCVADPSNPIEPEQTNKRPDAPRTLTIDAAIEENKDSRIYLGVHWKADVEGGSLLGKKLAEDIFASFPKVAK
jgi:hypothetical protein